MMKKAGKISLYGLMLALSLVLSYLEALFPFDFLVPGIKLGLSNMVTVFGLYTIGFFPTILIGFLRVVLVSALFGNMVSFLYSFSGLMFSLVGMILLKRFGGFSSFVVSIAGGVLHNIGQLLVAIILFRTPYLLSYLTILFPAGVVSGLLIGILAGMVLYRLKPFFGSYLQHES